MLGETELTASLYIASCSLTKRGRFWVSTSKFSFLSTWRGHGSKYNFCLDERTVRNNWWEKV